MVVVVANNSNLVVSCNFPTLNNPPPPPPPPHVRKKRTTVSLLTHRFTTTTTTPLAASGRGRGWCFNTQNPFAAPFLKRNDILICHDSNKDSQVSSEGGEGRDWTTSILLFFLWAGLLYYVSFLSPNQTPSRDMYFLKKLLNLKGDDGFRMNEVLVSVWYIMGLWPLVYSKLLLPTARSSKSSIPVWPFLVLSCFGGIYALLPYFVLWNPPAPPVEETELKTRPLNLLESKLTSMILLATGIGLITYAGLSGEDVWKEYYQYFRESKFIHIMSIDFALLSTLAPFWVYNDMTARKWFDKGSWLIPVSLVPFLGPSLYLLLRPSLSTSAASKTPLESE